jgi:FkbH-like protein
MFEPHLYQQDRHAEVPARPSADYTVAQDVERMSLLVWGEHCIECAAPACYQTCDLYERRTDGRCRRFTFGIYRNPTFKSLRGYGAEVWFKKWGKLEARGNTFMEPIRAVLAKERLLEGASRVAGLVGPVPAGITRDDRWRHLAHSLQERICRRLHRRRRQAEPPEAFLLEIYNPTTQPCRIQLSMNLAKEASAQDAGPSGRVPPFITTLEFKPGYNRHEVDRRAFQHITERGLPFDIGLTPEADSAARLIFLTADFVSFAQTRREGAAKDPQGPGIKCLVWDLDNTLWDGVLLENEEVQVNPHVPAILKLLDERGILHSIASKNDRLHAWSRLERLGLAEYFLFPQIAWTPKSQSIRQIAEQLNIGIDTLAFIDDNPFELDEVARALPEVLCIHVQDLGSLAEHPRCAGSTSADAKQRRQFYKVAMLREEKRVEFGDDYLAFLSSCAVELEIQRFAYEDSDRVAELVQRTNQLNFSGTKYDRTQVAELLGRQDAEKYVLRCSDRYGLYGVVGFSVVARDGGEIRVHEFMLSCRVQGKFIEKAFLHFLVETHAPNAPERIMVNFRQTARNTPARQVLESLGFESGPNGDRMRLDLAARDLRCQVVSVRHNI